MVPSLRTIFVLAAAPTHRDVSNWVYKCYNLIGPESTMAKKTFQSNGCVFPENIMKRMVASTYNNEYGREETVLSGKTLLP